jgi:general stress protein 26
VEIVDDANAKRRNWLPELDRWFPRRSEDPSVALIRIDATAAQWWTDERDGIADLA